MKLLGPTFSMLLAASSASTTSAFSPSKPGSYRSRMSTSLNAETLEGWKVKGDVKPVNNFILIKLADVQEKSEGGILFSKSAKVKKTEGTVISVGPGKPHADSGLLYPMPVEAGDGVVYGQYDGTELSIDGVRHSLIRDDDILIKFSGDADNSGGEGSGLDLEMVEAINDCVLVHVQTKETETSGGLLLATSSSSQNQRPSTGVVAKVGPGRMAESGELIAMTVAEGDMVKFRDFAGNEVKIGSKEYSVVRMPDIIAKF